MILLDNTATDSNNHNIIDIYDEDEEMTPTINTESAESEEVSEDDIAFESEYERMMEEFNEGNVKVIKEVMKMKMMKKQAKKHQMRKSSINFSIMNNCHISHSQMNSLHISTISESLFFVGCKNIIYVSCIISSLQTKI